ncbi:MAG: ATP-binding cassette domain-containing protein [Dehalococcoidia bacterium]
MALMQAENLLQQVNRKTLILKDVNLTIDRGDVLVIIGPTGAGKTTLIRLLDLLDYPSGGRIVFDGVDVTRSRGRRLAARRRIAYVQQKPIVFSMNVHDNVACGLRFRHQKTQIVREKVKSALDLVGLAGYEKRDARTLSGGETQRVAIARALVTDPELLLLDEPTANLDPVSTSKIEEVLADIIRSGRTTLLMSTHDMKQGQRLARRVGVLMNGELVQVGPKDEIFERPNGKVAGFLGVKT